MQTMNSDLNNTLMACLIPFGKESSKKKNILFWEVGENLWRWSASISTLDKVEKGIVRKLRICTNVQPFVAFSLFHPELMILLPAGHLGSTKMAQHNLPCFSFIKVAFCGDKKSNVYWHGKNATQRSQKKPELSWLTSEFNGEV